MKRIIGTTATRIFKDDKGYTNIQYHNTVVCKFNELRIVLRSGGWYTNTTKNRINQTSNQYDLGVYVFQKNWDWFVSFKGNTYPFEDGMVIVR